MFTLDIKQFLIIVLLASAVGKVIVKSPELVVLSVPKSNTATALFADPAG